MIYTRFIALTFICLLSSSVYFNYFNLVFVRDFLPYFEPAAIFFIFVLAAISTTKFLRTLILIIGVCYYLSPALLEDSCNFPVPSAALKAKLNDTLILETTIGLTQIWILQTSRQLNTWEEYTMLRRLALAAYTWPHDSVIFFPRAASFKLQERLLQKISQAQYVCTAGDYNIFATHKGN